MVINPVLLKIRENPAYGSSEQDYLFLYTIARCFQVKRIVEIGTHQGASLIAMSQAILDNSMKPELWTIDNWSLGNHKEEASTNFKEAGIYDFVNFVEGDSKEVLPNLFKEIGKVDLVFVDGDHAYESVLSDYNNSKEFTDLMMFHDTQDGIIKYWKENKVFKDIFEDRWDILTVPTFYTQLDDPSLKESHNVGITLAIKDNN